jgi:uncharacterized protein
VFVGVARLVLHIPHARSKKDRRQVMNKLKDRVRSRFSVSLCEVGDTERHQVARLGLATVGRDSATCQRVLGNIRRMAETQADAVLTDFAAEITSYGESGAGVEGGVEALSADGIVQKSKEL